jgi:DNA-binding NtrC family response regulator
MLIQKIENISVLMSSLNAAVQDLECAQGPALNEEFDFYNEVRRFETRLINTALRLTGGSQVKAAQMLKLKATTLNAKMKALKLSQTQVTR